jgi:hypothetical protein
MVLHYLVRSMISKDAKLWACLEVDQRGQKVNLPEKEVDMLHINAIIRSNTIMTALVRMSSVCKSWCELVRAAKLPVVCVFFMRVGLSPEAFRTFCLSSWNADRAAPVAMRITTRDIVKTPYIQQMQDELREFGYTPRDKRECVKIYLYKYNNVHTEYNRWEISSAQVEYLSLQGVLQGHEKFLTKDYPTALSWLRAASDFGYHEFARTLASLELANSDANFVSLEDFKVDNRVFMAAFNHMNWAQPLFRCAVEKRIRPKTVTSTGWPVRLSTKEEESSADSSWDAAGDSDEDEVCEEF